MKKPVLLLLLLFSHLLSSAQITVLSSYDPSNTTGLCGIGYYPGSSVVWAYGCNDAQFHSYDTAGNVLNSFPTPGSSANDVDIEIAPVQFFMNGTMVTEGSILFINGEVNQAEVYVVDSITGIIADTLITLFGNDHVVGGAYHPSRNTFFLVQDNVPGAATENLIAEVDPANGDTLNIFQITSYFSVSYGDIDIGANGNLFIVSSAEDSIAEFTPTGIFVQMHALPVAVNGLSGLALDCANNQAWACSESGIIYHLGNFPCQTSGIDEKKDFQLSEVRPNPFSSEALFSINIKRRGHVEITLTDISGRTVTVLHDEEMEEGLHTFSIRENIHPGIYMMTIKTANSRLTKKLICTK
jgi:hypothetical protein